MVVRWFHKRAGRGRQGVSKEVRNPLDPPVPAEPRRQPLVIGVGAPDRGDVTEDGRGLRRPRAFQRRLRGLYTWGPQGQGSGVDVKTMVTSVTTKT